jgi:hypothetical protein
MKSITLLAATAALTVSSVAVAGPNWTYAELGYVAADSIGDEDSGGFVLNGSFGFADVFHVGGGIGAFELEGGKSKGGIDADSFNVYVGYNPAMTDNVDAIVRVGYAETEGKAVGGRAKAKSLGLTFGTRAMISEQFELNAFATYAAGNSKPNAGAKEDFVDWNYTVGGIYNFTDMFAAGVSLTIDSNPIEVDGVEITSGNAGTLFARINF